MALRLDSATGLVDGLEVTVFAQGLVRHLALQSVLTADAFVRTPYPGLSAKILGDWMDMDMDVIGGGTVERWARLPGTIDTQDRKCICVVMLQRNPEPPERLET